MPEYTLDALAKHLLRAHPQHPVCLKLIPLLTKEADEYKLESSAQVALDQEVGLDPEDVPVDADHITLATVLVLVSKFTEPEWDSTDDDE